MPTTTPLYEQRRPHRPQSLVGAFSTKRLNEHNHLPHNNIQHKRTARSQAGKDRSQCGNVDKRLKNIRRGYFDLYSLPCPRPLGGCPFRILMRRCNSVGPAHQYLT